MKISFENLGTIAKTSLDLKPLTVIIGPNNSSKTYIAYSIYGLHKSALSAPWPRADLWKRGVMPNSIVTTYDAIAESLNAIVPPAVEAFREEMVVFFQDSSHKLFADTRFDLRIDRDDVARAAYETVAWLGPPSRIEGETVILQIDPADSVPLSGSGVASGVFPSDLVFLAEGFMGQMLKAIFPDPFVLPAERNAFIITYKMLANRRYKVLKDAQREMFGITRGGRSKLDLFRADGDLRYPKPIEDFLEFLTDIELSADMVIDPTQKDAFSQLADKIEQKLQNKNRPRLRPTTLGGREIQVDVKRGLSIDLYNASSAIKQLTPLLLYLRYKSAPRDFLIIDEPEMNLHPTAQAKLLEILGILVNLGVRVLITTHSPYFMAHLNNLISADVDNPDLLKRQAQALYLGDDRSFLAMDQVSAYEMRDNELVSLLAPDRGLLWDTLSETAAELHQKLVEITSRKSRRSGPPSRRSGPPSMRVPPPSMRAPPPSIRPPPSSMRAPPSSMRVPPPPPSVPEPPSMRPGSPATVRTPSGRRSTPESSTKPSAPFKPTPSDD